MFAARRFAVLLGLLAVLTLPAAGGAASPATGVNDLRTHDTSLAAQEQAATQALYSLESQLARARSNLASLEARREASEGQLTRLRIELDVVWRSVYIAEARLGGRLRQLYQAGAQDPLSILLGVESLNEAISRLEGLRNLAAGDRDIVLELRRAKAELTAARRQVAARAAALRQAEDAAAATTARLEAAAAERKAYLAALARERGFTAKRIARVERTARAAEQRSAIVAVAAPNVSPAPTRASEGGEQTLTVTSTGYSMGGHTSSGLATGWGIVAVDPSVIPLGTRLTIPGYGEGVAADTGGGIRGATIDLWFPSIAEARAWGRRTVTITLH